MIVLMLMGVVAAPIMAIQQALPACVEFFSMIDSPKVSYTGLSEPEISSHENIEFKNVDFAYPTRSDVRVLKGFSARFLKGKTTALVGPSGSGKSTIVALLERWYELESIEAKSGDVPSVPEKSDESQQTLQANSGMICIGDCNITEIDLKWLRSQIGLVQQEPFLFNDTILNNVALGLTGTKWEKVDASTKETLVQKACEEAFADEFIRQLPDVSTETLRELLTNNSRDIKPKLERAVSSSAADNDNVLQLPAALFESQQF